MFKFKVSIIFLIVTLHFKLSWTLWPIPTQITSGSNLVLLSPKFTFVSNLDTIPPDLASALIRTKTHLFNDKLGRLTLDRGASDITSSSSTRKHPATLHSLQFFVGETHNIPKGVKDISEEAILKLEDRDEEYSLYLPANGTDAVLRARTTLGILRGLTTFEQLWYTWDDQVYAINAPIEILDRPVYVNLLCDVCRTLLIYFVSRGIEDSA